MSADALNFNVSNKEADHPRESWLSWVVCLVAGLFFFYEFIQMNMFNAIGNSFMHAFKVRAHTMGLLDSFYFIANVLFLVPAGYLLDRFSIRSVILFSMLFCIIGTAGIAIANTISLAMFFRFLTGIGSAFCFLSCIRLATHWFHPKRIGLVIGVVLTEAMLGGVVSQKPLTMLVQQFDWQMALLMDAGFGLVIWLIIYWVIQDAPAGHEPRRLQATDRRAAIESYKYGFRCAFGNLFNWLIGIYASLINFPLAVLGGMWGISYLTARFGWTDLSAAAITSALFFGMMLGSPLAGYISDSFKNRIWPMMIGSLLLAASLLALLLIPDWAHVSLLILFFAIGLFSGIQVVAYPVVAERARPEVLAMSVSIVNISVMSGGGIIKPLFGLFMDWHQQVTDRVGQALGFGDYCLAMWLLPAFILVAILSVIASQRK